MDQEKIGKLIEQCRKQSKLTQEQLAEKLFVDRSLVSKWENGKLCPDIKYFQELCNIFDIELAELISGERKNNDNKHKLNTNLFNFFLKLNKKAKILKYTIIALLIIIFSFLSYYFLETYNKTRVYTIYGASEHFIINQGLLVLTRERSYFVIDNINNDIDNISIYYKNKNDKKILYEGNNIKILVDFSGYDSVINITNYKELIDNIYVDIISKDVKETIHLSLKEDYKNTKLWFKDDKEIDNNEYYDNLKETNILLKCDEDICNYIDGDYQILYDTTINKIAITNNSDIYIDYFLDNKYFDYSSSNINFFVDDGKISCNKDNCEEERKIYNEFYTKYIEPIEKN